MGRGGAGRGKAGRGVKQQQRLAAASTLHNNKLQINTRPGGAHTKVLLQNDVKLKNKISIVFNFACTPPRRGAMYVTTVTK